MSMRKVTQHARRDKVHAVPTAVSVEYDHHVALDWSLKIMAVAHFSRRDRTPRVFERPAEVKELKAYLATLKGRIIITFEESGFAHWLYLELLDCVTS